MFEELFRINIDLKLDVEHFCFKTIALCLLSTSWITFLVNNVYQYADMNCVFIMCT